MADFVRRGRKYVHITINENGKDEDLVFSENEIDNARIRVAKWDKKEKLKEVYSDDIAG